MIFRGKIQMGGSPMVSQTSGELTNIEKASQLFKILGNPKRLRLIYLLIQHSMSVSEISERLLQSESDIAANRICSQRDLDDKIKGLLNNRDGNL